MRPKPQHPKPLERAASLLAKRLTDILNGETFARATTAQQRRIFNWIAFELWLTLGTLLWYTLRNSLWFVGLMSLYAIVWGHFISWAAETPVEQETT